MRREQCEDSRGHTGRGVHAVRVACCATPHERSGLPAGRPGRRGTKGRSRSNRTEHRRWQYVVAIRRRAGVVRRELLEPARVVLVQPRLIVVDEDRRRDVKRVDEAEPFLNAALRQGLLDVRRDVDE